VGFKGGIRALKKRIFKDKFNQRGVRQPSTVIAPRGRTDEERKNRSLATWK